MKTYFIKNRILVFFALVGLLASLFPMAARIRAEEENKQYDLVISYSSLRAMAEQSAMDEEAWLRFFRSLGVDKVALGESSLRSLSDSGSVPVHASALKNVRSSYNWEMRYPQQVVDWVNASSEMTDALVCAETKEAFDWICSALEERGDDLTYSTYEENGQGFLFIPKQAGRIKGNDILDLGLGIWPETAQRVERCGMRIIPRTVTVDGLNGETFASAFVNVLKQYGSPYFINSGDSWLGYDNEAGISVLKDYLRQSGIGVCMFEENDQSQNLIWDGVEDLLGTTGYNGVRTFNEWSYIQNRYAYCGYEGSEEITNSLFRAIAERNCKVIYLKMILEPDNDVSTDADESEWTYITEPADYKQMLDDLDARLGDLGYTHQDVRAMELSSPSAASRILEGIGVAALFVMLLDLLLFLDGRMRYALLLVGALGAAALFLVRGATYKILLSMAGGIVMPSLAGVGLCRILARKRREQAHIGFAALMGYTVLLGLGAVLVSLGSSILASSALSELSYIIEIDLYRGVKLMQLIPIALFALGYLLVFAYEETGAKDAVLANIGPRGEKGRLRKLRSYLYAVLDRPMKLSWFVVVVLIVLAALFVLVAGIYYISRTGNSTSVSAAELQFRNMLENRLIARPRTKELLIGWPCLLLFIWSLRRGMNFLPLVFGLGMSIGLVSIVNTFLHIRTPFLLSLLRTGWGVLFGFILGLAAVLIAELVYRLIKNVITGSRHV